ncbi:SANT/Myb domain-containing protein [Phanerochaete sordida]|uniref:SANT/Myb domain-containing protein n=1 Tax=Phanerochaete sordida TaxID=48140 RepID=A0A9P3G6E7_9APHY|nr:SANT/Myb domain-containing protein [Phanerochaete sordida]
MLPPLALPATSTFSFTAPYPASVSQPPLRPPTKLPVSASTPTSPSSVKGQRRVSLALPSSPRQFPAWSFRDDTTLRVGNSSNDGAGAALLPEKKGKIRRIADDADASASESVSALFSLTSLQHTASTVPPPPTGSSTAAEAGSSNPRSSSYPSPSSSEPPKKTRKKWTAEETQMLVTGCNKYGVGNWKAILNDPELRFDSRSPVDLKDRFRTYFPDAYKIHYPNAKTHLPSASASANRSSNSSKSRSMLPDGSPLFLQSRQKKRRPFTPEEDRALKEGYDKHGTVWATIVKDPVFKEQGRRSTDLRDRFRNAWPELYAKAGYKPRANAAKKKRLDLDADGVLEGANGPDALRPSSEPSSAPASATLDAAMALGNGAERPRGHPIRAATDDQLPTTSTSGVGPVRRKRRHTTQGFGLFRNGTKSSPESMANTEDEASESEADWDGPFDEAAQPPTSNLSSASLGVSAEHADVDMDIAQDPSVPDFVSTSSLSMSDLTDSSSQAHTSWSELDTPLHPWSSTPSSSQQSNQGQTQGASSSMAFNESLAASPTSTDYFLPHSPNAQTGSGMIGKSAWGPQDWLSPNPRLDGSGDSFTSGIFSPSPIGSPSLYSSSSAAPSHPVSLAQLSFSHLALASGSGSQSNAFSHGHSAHVHSQAYSHGVMDRYDLFPPSSHLYHGTDDFDVDTFDLDFISEGPDAASSDVHSAFSDPSSAWAQGARRGGFTHHSNYAGDLIFGARTHQPSGYLSGMDYGPGFGFGLGTGPSMGLGLEGAQQSVLHTPALPGIDEIELTSISLNDPLPNDKEDMPMALEEVVNANMVSSPPPPEATSPGGDSQDSFQPLSLDDIVGIPPEPDGVPQAAEEHDTSHHITPPATPVNTFRAPTRSQTGLSLQHRSVSVPPSEHRAFQPPPRPGQSQVTSPKAKYKNLMMTPTRATFAVPQLPASLGSPSSMPPPPPPAVHSPPAPPPPPPLMWPTPDAGDNDLPFLDLHYFSSSDFLAMGDAFGAGSLQLGAQALDLAQALTPPPPHAPSAVQKPLCVPPALVQPPPPPSSFKGIHAHHRGQSATAVVSPQDLFVRHGRDNKRKRASWDGGPK